MQQDDAAMQHVDEFGDDAFVSSKSSGMLTDVALEINKRRERAQKFICKQVVNEYIASQCPTIVTSR